MFISYFSDKMNFTIFMTHKNCSREDINRKAHQIFGDANSLRVSMKMVKEFHDDEDEDPPGYYYISATLLHTKKCEPKKEYNIKSATKTFRSQNEHTQQP